MSHTYSVHLTVLADTDEDARDIAALVAMRTREARSFAVTDADDWAEHITVMCGVSGCGAPSANRVRNGTGRRVCRNHTTVEYPITNIIE